MMKNTFTMNFVLFISFLVVGYAVSKKFYHPTYAIANAPGFSISTNSNSVQVMKNGQQSYLLMFVDKLDPDQAQLESLWLVTNLPSAALNSALKGTAASLHDHDSVSDSPTGSRTLHNPDR